MIPSLRRCILAVALMGGSGIGSEALAQQAGAPAPQQAAAGKAPAPKTEAAKKKAEAKAKADAQKKAKADPAAAQGEVENGINALAQGRHDAAVTSLSAALSAGSLPSAQTARALYYRGVAHRRQGKPALAISDLTNALWIKSGLTEEQRADALQQRSGAYREAGLPDQADPPSAKSTSTAKAGSSSAPFAAVAPAAPVSSTSISGSGGSLFGSLFGGGPSTPPPPPAPKAAAAPATAGAPATTASVAARPAAPPTPVTSASPAPFAPAGQSSQTAKPATRVVPIITPVHGGTMGFHDTQEPVRHVEVSTQARAAQTMPPAAGIGAVARPWNEATMVKQAALPASRSQPKADGAAPVQQAARPSPPAAGGPATGSVRIQVAAVRSAAEAQGVTARLQQQFARELGGRAPIVDQVSAGNFGNFYRVQVGPFASARETEELCAKLKSGGLDCRIVN